MSRSMNVLPSFTLLLGLLSVSCLQVSGAENRNVDWPAYLGGKERNLYSAFSKSIAATWPN